MGRSSGHIVRPFMAVALPALAWWIGIAGAVAPTPAAAESATVASSARASAPAQSTAGRSRVAPALRERAASLGEDASLRVIVALEGAPARRLEREARGREAQALRALDERVRAELLKQSGREPAAEPAVEPSPDRDRHAEMTRAMQADREALRPLARERERISRRIQQSKLRALRAELAPEHARVARALRALGAEVEHSLGVINALVVRLPAARLDEAAAIPGVARLAADSLEIGHLTEADDATLASAPGGLWAGGGTGGTFDPAIVDNGVDLANPLLADATGYTNFWTIALGMASGDPSWADALDVDDREGHGTHVQGIVASHGSPGHPAHLGLAYGVEKVVHLKAGFCCSVQGNTAMYNTDRMIAVDRALALPELLDSAAGTGLFLDDVDGLNISYGGSTVLDETESSLFVDAVIDGFGDTPITVSVGNSGPVAASINSPAIAYNAIAVANVDDQGTASRADDSIEPTSSRGPTPSGRRKPDLAAPGTAITAPNSEWETEVDVVDRTGTSMAAPMVLGVLMDLMEAGVTDELQLKALLINTAQKNDGAIDFDGELDDEHDDGWDPAYGWGYMNTLAAYQHRIDVRSGSLTEAGQSGDYVLYAGTMQDEGPAGEGRDRATLVWNRHVDYAGGSVPTGSYALSDLDLHLYDAATGEHIDEDATAIDNVHQVRVAEGAPATPVVIRVEAASAAFPSGDATEEFALATEEGFVPASLPVDLPATASWPAAVEPGEQFVVEFWVSNEDVLASHANLFDLALPPGFTLDAGSDPFDAGSIAGGATDSTHALWTITAAGPDGDAAIGIDHTHTSYGESWGPGSWSLPFTVATDVTPPTPDVMSFAWPPTDLSTTQLIMQALIATDEHAPVVYRFDFVSSPSGGTGGADRDWDTLRTYTNGGLQANHEYCYSVRARDAAQTPNETAPSPTDCEYTKIEPPAGVEFGAVTATSIEARSLTAHSNLGLGSSGVRISNATTLTDSGWNTSNGFWASAPLAPNTAYGFVARARNGDGTQTPSSPTAVRYTLALAPVASGFGAVSESSIEVLFGAGANPAGTLLQAENLTTQGLSPWAAASSWVHAGLAPNSTYDFVVRARNGDGLVTADVVAGSATTLAEAPLALAFGPRTHFGIEARFDAGGNPPGTEYRVENETALTDSGWITDTSWLSDGLAPSTSHAFRVKARNADGVETGWVALGDAVTLAPPAVPGVSGLARLALLGALALAGGLALARPRRG